MNFDEINKGQYTIITIGVILITALLFATFRLYFWIKSQTMPLLEQAIEGTTINASQMQSIFTDIQKTIIITYFILSGFILISIIAGFILLRDKAHKKSKVKKTSSIDSRKKPFYDINAFSEAAVTLDENDIIINRFDKINTADSGLKIPSINKTNTKKSKRKVAILLILTISVFVYILYNVLAPGYYKAKALKMQEAGKYKEAVSFYDKVIKIKSKSPEIYYGKGFSLSKQGNYKEAVECFSKAIDLNPKYYEAYYNKAIALTYLKESDNALYNFDMAISLKPDKIEAYEAKGQLFEELERYDRALECYEKIYELDPGYKDIKSKIDNLSSSKTPASTEPVVIYEPETGSILDSTVFRVIRNGKQQIALTGKNKAMNYSIIHFTGDVIIKSVDNMYSENLFITSKESPSITIRPDTYKLTVKDRLIITGHAEVYENKFDACLMDNTGNTILRFGVNVQPNKEGGEGLFTIDIPIDQKKIKSNSGYLALIQEVIDDGNKVGIIKIPVKFQ